MKLLTLTCGIILLVQSAFGHAPFDGSARVIVTSESAEVLLTTGKELAGNFLRETIPVARLSTVGRPMALPLSIASNLLEISADGHVLAPQSADVVTDGTEVQFHIVCPLSPSKRLRVQAFYLGKLKPPQVSPLIATDENGNIFGSAMLAPGKEVADFDFPAKLFPIRSESDTVTTTAPSPPVARPHPSFAAYLQLGIFHILTGYDHLLFLCALLLGCRRFKPMLAVITGFTLAHSLTLALATLNVVMLPSRLAEPLIAASIVIVALENFQREEKPWHRYTLTCGFGLVHGFGFASALRETGLAGHGLEIASPLLAFNVGVEAGQLAVAGIVLPLLFALQKVQWFAARGRLAFSALVILIATFWLWQRMTGA